MYAAASAASHVLHTYRYLDKPAQETQSSPFSTAAQPSTLSASIRTYSCTAQTIVFTAKRACLFQQPVFNNCFFFPLPTSPHPFPSSPLKVSWVCNTTSPRAYPPSPASVIRSCGSSVGNSAHRQNNVHTYAMQGLRHIIAAGSSPSPSPFAFPPPAPKKSKRAVTCGPIWITRS